MHDLRNTIHEFTDEQLRTAFSREKDQYTDEALTILHDELVKRGLSVAPDEGEKAAATPLQLNSEDFVNFDYAFSRTDLLLATAVLRDNGVIFFVDNPTSADIIPFENEAQKRYYIHVHKSSIDKSHELLDEHFVKRGSSCLSKYTGTRERLQAFNFNDIHPTESTLEEEIDVSLSAAEKKIIIALGTRLLNEADQIEKNQDRVLFYYDSFAPLVARLQEPGRCTLSRNDLLSMLEILQVYSGDPALPPSMDETITRLLDFFLQA